MCTNRKQITVRVGNHFQTMVVNCGHCPACLQEKADKRAQRIKNALPDGWCYLFVTLTYANECIPYIRRSHLLDFGNGLNSDNIEDIDNVEVPVFRDSTDFHVALSKCTRPDFDKLRIRVNRAFLRGKQNWRYRPARDSYVKRTYETVVLPKGFEVPTHLIYSDKAKESISTLQSLKKGDSDKIGVAYYPDLQNFIKKLSQNLKRNYGIETKPIWFACSEYGPCTHRPHFHLNIACPVKDRVKWTAAIAKSWSYDNNRISQYIEVARNSAYYVSSYVNCGTSLPALLCSHDFKCKHSYSFRFGFGLPDFSYEKIKEKIYEGTVCYTKSKYTVNGNKVVSVPLPSYVIRRYFFKFKGFSRLTPDEVYNIVLRPESLYNPATYEKLLLPVQEAPTLYGSNQPVNTLSEVYKVYIALKHRIVDLCGTPESNPNYYCDLVDYAYCYSRVWQMYSSITLRVALETHVSTGLDWIDYYDNFGDVNKKTSIEVRNRYLVQRYIDKDKSKKLSNYNMSQSNHYV